MFGNKESKKESKIEKQREEIKKDVDKAVDILLEKIKDKNELELLEVLDNSIQEYRDTKDEDAAAIIRIHVACVAVTKILEKYPISKRSKFSSLITVMDPIVKNFLGFGIQAANDSAVTGVATIVNFLYQQLS